MKPITKPIYIYTHTMKKIDFLRTIINYQLPKIFPQTLIKLNWPPIEIIGSINIWTTHMNWYKIDTISMHSIRCVSLPIQKRTLHGWIKKIIESCVLKWSYHNGPLRHNADNTWETTVTKWHPTSEYDDGADNIWRKH